VAGVTRIDGCPSDLLGPLTTPADTKGFASDEPRVEASTEREHSFSPAALPHDRLRGERRGRKNAKGSRSKEEEARSPIASADGLRSGRKTDKMPECGLT
jgi:hypothetical protein